jgi:DNA repair exonuclease SbcCD ATPase subunit
MKKILIAFLAFIPAILCSAQSYEGTITYDKQKQQAIVIDYTYPPEAVENAIVQKIEQMGYKGKTEKGIFNKDKGFIVFKSAFITDISDNSMDYIIKVERKSRKEKDETTLYLVMNKNGENAMPSLTASSIGQAKSFLNNLLPEIEVANLELQIQAQEEAVAKAEKKFKDLQDDQQKLEKKIRNLQEDLEKNGKNQENQQKEIEAQKQALEALRAKRTPAL